MVEAIRLLEDKIPKYTPVKRNDDGSFSVKDAESPEFTPLTKNEDGTFSVTKTIDDNDDYTTPLLNRDQIKINENAFEDKTSGVIEETVATFEKQAAFLGLLANGFNLVSDEDVAPFIAERSAALHNAQLHAPKYVKRFQKEFEAASGFFESAGVIMSNPRAIGRLIVTQTPNSILPLGAGFVGGTVGSAVPLLGTLLGFAGGTFIGGAIVETGAWMDQQMGKRGVNMSDPDAVLKILQDEAFMAEVVKEASRKGISTAAVDTLFSLFGGKLLSGAGKGVIKKGARFAGDVGVESVGEGVGEAAGQLAAVGKVDPKEAFLEAVAGLGQSTGQAGLGFAFRKTKETVKTVKEEGKVDGKKEEAKAEAEGVSGKGKATEVDILAKRPEDLSLEEIEILIEEESKSEEQILVDLFGKEGAKRYNSLSRRANSPNLSGEQLDKAAAELAAMEDTLSKEQQDKLFGVFDPDEISIELLKGMRKAILDSRAEDGSATELGESLQFALTRVGNETDPVNMSDEELVAFVQIREAFDIAQEKGFDLQEVSNAAIKKAAKRFSDPADAAFILDRFIKSAEKQSTLEDVEKGLEERKTDAEVVAEAKRTPEQREKRKAAIRKGEDKKRLKETLKKIQSESQPLVEKPERRAVGVEGQLQVTDKFANTLSRAFNTVKRKFIALTPMNVVFDLMDTATKPFTGINFMTFKRTLDIRNRERAVQKSAIETPILNFKDEKNLGAISFRKILVAATLQQDKGREKLLRSFSEEELVAAEEKGLTEDEQTMLSMMRAAFEKLKPQLKAVMKDVYGKDFKEVEDFFPMLTDFEAMENTEIQNLFGDDAKLIFDLIIPERKPNTKDVSTEFLTERKGGGVPIKLNALEVFIKHVDNATYLINMGKDINELLALAKTDEYGEAVGAIGQDSVVSWLRLMARRGGVEGNRVASLDWLRNNVGVAVLGYKLSTILIQPTALLDGAALIGGRAFTGAIDVTVGPQAKEWRSFIKKHFVEIQLRVADDPAFAAFMENITDNSLISKIKKNAFWGVRKMDGITATAIAAGAYKKIVTEKGDVVDFNNPDQDAILEAELIVSRSQASGQFKDVPAAVSQGKFTGNVSVDKLMFQFQTFLLGRFSIVTHALLKHGLRPTQENVNIATFLALAFIAEVLVRRGTEEIMAVLTGDEPDEPLSDIFFEKLAGEVVGAIPIVGQAVNAVRYKQVPIPVISLTQQGITRAGLTISTNDGRKKRVQAARAIIELAGVIGGVPGASQIDQIIGKVFKTDKKKKGKVGSFR